MSVLQTVPRCERITLQKTHSRFPSAILTLFTAQNTLEAQVTQATHRTITTNILEIKDKFTFRRSHSWWKKLPVWRQFNKSVVQQVFRWNEGDGDRRPLQHAGEIPIRIPQPFKDQWSTNKLREQLSDLSRKINNEMHPVFKSHKIKDELKAKKPKPPIVNQQNVVVLSFFKCDLCDADYVGFTSRHIHQRVECGGT